MRRTDTSGSRRSVLALGLRALLVIAVIGGITVVAPGRSEALATVTVRVIIEKVEQQGCTDDTDGSDFYGFLTIAGQTVRFPRMDEQDVITPTDWKLEKLVDVNTSPVPVRFDLWEFDTFGTFEDDHCEITGTAGEELDLSVPLIPCSVAGDVAGACATSLVTEGDGGGDGDAKVTFRVEVDEPPAAAGLTVRCTQTPLWPQPGDDVTITAESLDGTVEVADGVDHTKIADSIEIWVGDRTGADQVETGKTTSSFVVNDVPAGDLVYACRVRDEGASVFTGWRRARVGPPAEGKAVPVIFTGERKSRVDIVFIADADSYDDAKDADFLTDVNAVLKGAYFGQSYFLANQDKFNFWLADQTGDADSVPDPAAPTDPAKNTCVHALPANWGDDYTWRDSGAILHTDTFRDCASNGVFSVEPTSLPVVLHETGHAPFGLADEYPGPNFGGYFEKGPNPNLWDTKAECEADAVTLGRVAGDCRSFTDTRPDPDQVWWLSDPVPAAPPADLMDENGPPRAADIRRIDWFFTNCVAGTC